MFDLYKEFEALIKALDQSGIDYAVCGGLAMAVWGAPRATVGIDILILEEAYDHAKGVAKYLGFTAEATPMTFSQGAVEIRRLSKIDRDTGIVLPLDFLLVTPQIIDIWESRIKVAWESSGLWVVSQLGLIALKSLRSSSQDIADIERLREMSDEG